MNRFFKGLVIFVGIAAGVLILAASFFIVMKLFVGESLGASSLDVGKSNTDETRAVDNVTDGRSDDERINVLILGKDDSSGLCDMIMLASYNMTKGSIGIVQIPRDTYAKYSSSSYKKLNGALSAFGSEKDFCHFLEDTMRIRIDEYVTVNLSALSKVIDAIGGVEVNVPCDMDYDDPAQGLSIHLKKGRHTLDGRTAEQFVRFRSGYVGGDLGRIDAQKIFLAAISKKLSGGMSIKQMGAIAAAVVDDVKTSYPLIQLISVARQALSVPPEKISFVTLAGESAVAKKSGASYYVISRPSAIEIVNSLLGGGADEQSFDKDKLFLNEGYDEFTDIYYSKKKYTVYSAETLGNEGIEIDTVK